MPGRHNPVPMVYMSKIIALVRGVNDKTIPPEILADYLEEHYSLPEVPALCRKLKTDITLCLLIDIVSKFADKEERCYILKKVRKAINLHMKKTKRQRRKYYMVARKNPKPYGYPANDRLRIQQEAFNISLSEV